MNCPDCKRKMECIAVNDSPPEGYAYNVYHCIFCMLLVKEDVWNNAGTITIRMDGSVVCRSKR